jgi:hypothetical protein
MIRSTPALSREGGNRWQILLPDTPKQAQQPASRRAAFFVPKPPAEINFSGKYPQ